MNSKKSLKLDLTDAERKNLRSRRIKLFEISRLSQSELSSVLQVDTDRAKHILALIEFQMIPTIGIEFAKDLISIGFYHLSDLKDKDGPKLLDQYEASVGYQVDPCVEDQFRLVVYYAKHKNETKKWWDFTSERKDYRSKYGYPSSRPTKSWTELSVKKE